MSVAPLERPTRPRGPDLAKRLPYVAWDAVHLAELQTLVAAGLSDYKLAAHFGCSRKAIRNARCAHLGHRRRAPVTWPLAVQEQIRALIVAGLPYPEIARQAGVTRSTVRRYAVKWGLAHPTQQLWTAEEDARLEELVEDGWSHGAIARALGRTEAAVSEHRRRKLRLTLWPGDSLSQRQAGELFGVSEGVVTRWISAGLLAVKWRRHGKSRFALIDREASWDFVAVEEAWHLYEPERITDAELREYALEVRHGLRFLTLREAADELRVAEYQIRQWIKDGKLRAVRHGNWRLLVRSDWLAVPAEPKRPKRWVPYTDDERAFLAEWWDVQTVAALAAALEREPGAVYSEARRLGLPPRTQTHAVHPRAEWRVAREKLAELEKGRE